MRKTEIKIQFIISLYLICFQFENAGKAKKRRNHLLSIFWLDSSTETELNH